MLYGFEGSWIEISTQSWQSCYLLIVYTTTEFGYDQQQQHLFSIVCIVHRFRISILNVIWSYIAYILHFCSFASHCHEQCKSKSRFYSI